MKRQVGYLHYHPTGGLEFSTTALMQADKTEGWTEEPVFVEDGPDKPEDEPPAENVTDAFEATAAALEAQAEEMRNAENEFKDYREVAGAFNRAGWWLGVAAKEIRKLVQ